jgi:dihydroneopterin aldolase
MAADDDLTNGDDAFDDEEEGGAETVVTVEVTGLSIFAAVGVTEAEREVGTRLLLDLRMDVGECDATVTDMVEDTVDYAKVCQVAWLVAQERPYRTLERLCSVIADRILSDFPVEYVWVKAAKPEPPIPLPVEEVSVEVSREPAE